MCRRRRKNTSIACSLKGNGKFYIHDIDERKLKEADLRAKRAGVKFKRLEAKNLQKYCCSFDSVIADVPCSGSGAWRRNPQQKWRITPESFNEILIRQTIILNEVKDLIKKNGYIFYITCSVLKIENEEVIYKFLSDNKHFGLLNKKDVTIDNHGDGFFCAVLQKKN